MDALIYLSLALNVTAFVLWARQYLELLTQEDRINELQGDVATKASIRELTSTTDRVISRIWLAEQGIEELRKQTPEGSHSDLRSNLHQIALDAGLALAQVNKLSPAVDELTAEVRYLNNLTDAHDRILKGS